MFDKLQQIGLTEKEAKVYNAALSMNKATVDQLAKKAGIVRTTTYTQVESLMNKGLMSSITEGKKTYYNAEAPENLQRLIDQQEKEVASNHALLQTLLPDLSAIYNKNGSKPTVRFYSGKEGVITMRNEVLKMKGKELLVATSLDDFNMVFTKESERQDFTKRRQSKGIRTRMIFTSSVIEPPTKYAPEEFRQVSEKEFPFEFDIYIFDNKVAITSLQTDDIWSLLLESKAITSSMKNLFEMAWRFAERK